jgi:hypothetical protein
MGCGLSEVLGCFNNLRPCLGDLWTSAGLAWGLMVSERRSVEAALE